MQNKQRQKYIAAGKCYLCGKPPEEGRSKCRVCIDKQTKNANKHKTRNLKNGKCRVCGKARATALHCETHAQLHNEHSRKMKLKAVEAGRCWGCHRPLPEGTTTRNCPWCRADRKAREWK